MKGFDILRVKSAVKSHNKFDLSHSHLTTMDIGQIVPLYFEETVPGDQFNVKGNYFSRMTPLVAPSYGRIYFKTVHAFVPYIQLCDSIEGFLADKKSWEGETPSMRYITIQSLVSYLFSIASAGTSTDYDWRYVDSTGTTQYKKFTGVNKYYLKVLNALGYAIPQNVDEQTSSTWYITISTQKLSALPLLAFAKVYNDYMSQSQMFNNSSLTSLLKKIKHDKDDTGRYTASTHCLEYSGIKAILESITLCFENDYFTSAWAKPIAPLGIQAENQDFGSVPGFTSGDQISGSTIDNRIEQQPMDRINQRSLDFLKAFDDFVRRNNYSGSRAVQQVYSRFGIKTDDFRSNYAHIIGTSSTPIQVGDVTQTTPTTTSPLGDYAGKGIMNGSDGFSFKASDYGALIVLGYYTVAPFYSFGFFRHVLRNSPFDFYNPEFDGLGADAISYGEVYASPKPVVGDSTLDNSVFGFTERYNSYRYSRDLITGDFRNYDSGAEMNTWHCGRYLSALRDDGYLVAQHPSFMTLPQNDSEFDRLFTSPTGDNFFLTCYFNVSAVRPMLSLNQVPRLGEGDTVVPKNGNTIN